MPRQHRRLATTTRSRVLRHVLNVAIEAGVIYSNAAAAVKRAAVAGKEIALPTHRQIQRADCGNARGPQPRFAQLRRLRGGLGIHGCRNGEARRDRMARRGF